MDKETFDTAMKLNHGRTIIDGDKVCLREDDIHDKWVYIIAISPKDGMVYIKKINTVQTLDEYLDNQRYAGSGKRVMRFDEFLTRIKCFYHDGRK